MLLNIFKELLEMILSFLNTSEISNLSLTCKYMLDICKKELSNTNEVSKLPLNSWIIPKTGIELCSENDIKEICKRRFYKASFKVVGYELLLPNYTHWLVKLASHLQSNVYKCARISLYSRSIKKEDYEDWKGVPRILVLVISKNETTIMFDRSTFSNIDFISANDINILKTNLRNPYPVPTKNVIINPNQKIFNKLYPLRDKSKPISYVSIDHLSHIISVVILSKLNDKTPNESLRLSLFASLRKVIKYCKLHTIIGSINFPNIPSSGEIYDKIIRNIEEMEYYENNISDIINDVIPCPTENEIKLHVDKLDDWDRTVSLYIISQIFPSKMKILLSSVPQLAMIPGDRCVINDDFCDNIMSVSNSIFYGMVSIVFPEIIYLVNSVDNEITIRRLYECKFATFIKEIRSLRLNINEPNTKAERFD